MPHYRRTRKLINPSLQLKIVAIFVLLAFIAALFQVVLFNSTVETLLASPEAQEPLDLRWMLMKSVLTTMGLLGSLMFVIGVLVTYRIAGPVYRFEKHLEAIARGEDPGECRIRKGDELQPLCDRINAAVKALRARKSASEPAETRKAA